MLYYSSIHNAHIIKGSWRHTRKKKKCHQHSKNTHTSHTLILYSPIFRCSVFAWPCVDRVWLGRLWPFPQLLAGCVVDIFGSCEKSSPQEGMLPRTHIFSHIFYTFSSFTFKTFSHRHVLCAHCCVCVQGPL